MPRLVNAAKAAERVSEKHGIPLSELVDTFCDIATVDAVPVVRCRDCKRFELCYPTQYLQKINGHGFCSYGERRVDDAYQPQE